jgi:8-oxo-dGTP pyrophosphatase MutT (NUDIX family)
MSDISLEWFKRPKNGPNGEYIDFNALKDIDVDEIYGSSNRVSVKYGFGNMTQYKNAATILVYDNKTLIIKLSYNSRKWATPGGNIDKGEGALEAALRETREETQINIDMNNIKNLKTLVYKPTYTKLFIIYLNDNIPRPKLSGEHTQWKIVDLDYIQLEDLTDYARGAFKMLKHHNKI